MFWLVIPSMIGGITGALLLRKTPTHTFDRIIPFLILFATVLFTLPIQRWLGTPHEDRHRWAARTGGWRQQRGRQAAGLSAAGS